MNAFVATPAAPASPHRSVVKADGWFPDVTVAALREKVRIGENVVTHDRLVTAIERAMLTVFRAAGAWRSMHAALGVAKLEDIGTDEINGKPKALVAYELAILYYVAADIADTYRDVSATDQGTIRADEERRSSDDYRRMAHHSIADLISIGAATDVPRNRVELI